LDESLHRLAYRPATHLQLSSELDFGKLRLRGERSVEHTCADAISDQLRRRRQP
jgi:hypothetical protein